MWGRGRRKESFARRGVLFLAKRVIQKGMPGRVGHDVGVARGAPGMMQGSGVTQGSPRRAGHDAGAGNDALPYL